MHELNVDTSTHTYTISIAEGIRHQIKDYVQQKYSSILIITDDQIAPLYLQDIKNSLKNEKVFHAIVPSGEASKSIETYYHLQTVAMQNNLDRNSLMIALGGGVIGDLTGFVAATFMRGIDYIQVPTTILAHDSSVGGKVAINHELGKNMIGQFYPPKAVIYDVSTLLSLPAHEVRSGYAEIVKEAFIANKELLEDVYSINVQNVSNEQLMQHLFQGIKVKRKIVEQDEKEANIRKFLNFGHTLAHALETELGYGKITHGEAVAIGMLFALKVSEEKFSTSLSFRTYYDWLARNNYPITLFQVDVDRMIKHMKLDKKTENQQIQMVLLEQLEKPVVVELTDEEIKQFLQSFKKELDEA